MYFSLCSKAAGGGMVVCTHDQYGIDKSWVLLQPKPEASVDLTDE